MEFGSSQQRSNVTKPNARKIRIDDYDDPDVKNFLTTIDAFDTKIYENSIQGKTKFAIYQKESLKKEAPPLAFSVRFKEGIGIFKTVHREKEHLSTNLFTSMVVIDPLALKGGFKKKLSRNNKQTNWQKKENKYEQTYSSNDVALKRRVSANVKLLNNSKNLGIFENYETNDNPNGPKKVDTSLSKNQTYKPAYTSTLNLLNNKFQKKDVLLNDFNIPDLNISKEFKIPDDSVFSNRSRIVQRNRFNRPDWVEKLYDNYGYSDLDPWNKIQNHTKNKNLCLTVLKDIYNKITY